MGGRDSAVGYSNGRRQNRPDGRQAVFGAQLPKIIRGVKFTDGCEVIAKPGDLQSQTAAA
jgi:hypothetical protein